MMNNTKSSLKLVTALVLLALAFNGACTSQNPTGAGATPASVPFLPDDVRPTNGEKQTTTIRFACPAQDRAEFEALAAEFHAQNPSIQIEIVTVEDIIGNDYDNFALKLALAADTAYYLVDMRSVPKGLWRDLTPFIEGDSDFEPEDFLPHMLEAFQWKSGMWALPSQAWLNFLFYDKQIFDEAGVSYPTLDWTRSDFLDAAQQLAKRQAGEVTQYGFVDYSGDARHAFVYAWVDNFQEGRPQLYTPVVADAMRWYTDLALYHGLMPISAFTQEAFDRARALVIAGKAAMWSDGLKSLEFYRRSRDVGLVPFPSGREPVVPAFMYGYMISAGTEHSQESWRWLRFLSRQRILGPGNAYADWLPARRSTVEQTGYWVQFDEETINVVRYAAEHLSFIPSTNELVMQLNTAIDAVFKGKPVEEALAEAQAALEESLAQATQATPVPVVVATPRPAGIIGETVITFAPAGSDTVAYRQLAATFNQKRTNIEVQIINPNEATSADCFAGDRSAGQSLNLQPLLEVDATFSLDGFYPRFLDAFRYQGDLWGLPTQAQVRVVFYNRDLFDAAGVPYPETNWTLDDFLARAVTLTQGRDDEKQYGFLPLNGDASDLPVFVALQGAPLWDETGRPRLDAPDVVSAVRWYADLALRYGVMPALPNDLRERDPEAQAARYALVREGRVAMWTDFTGLDRSDIWPADVQVGMVPLPVGADKVTQFLHEGLFIASDTPHPQACWEWLKFISTQVTLVHELPARRSLLESAAFAEQVGQDAIETYRASLEYADALIPATSEASAQLHLLDQALADILEGALPEAALIEAQRQAEK